MADIGLLSGTVNSPKRKAQEASPALPLSRSPPTSPPPIYEPHQGEGRQYLRDIILGVNDGLVSMLLLVIGVYGGGLSTKDVLLTGITGAVAGAISMGIGEYIATKSQQELFEGDEKLEREHFLRHRRIEENEVRDVLATLNLSGKLLEDTVQAISASDAALMKFMMAFEFGQVEQNTRSPIRAMLTSGLLFVCGSLPSVLPFACTTNREVAVYTSLGLCAVSAFAVGAIKTISTRGRWWYSGSENLVLGAVGAAVSYGVGLVYGGGAGV
eukprot:TRINITY_DN7139_c0_g1_i5.p1 TRINITY_DN7139_c0_g1~~TRINITY_DN7139_c0_g1_i5.p1  ORF type:complete len:270 (-),score=49.26 TRINITY_DN7139_c0_g1_i5:6-815(-)